MRERLQYLRLFSIHQEYEALAPAAELVEGASDQIFELRVLQRYAEAISNVATRRQAFEESREKAQAASYKITRKLLLSVTNTNDA